MRLTLRTMLAYMDGILEPADAEDIAKKIEESETATKIYHRIRDVMRRLRLSAPGLTDRSPGLDANTVAEYLDNCLPGDRVPDFEKVCLESDVHLAEVASSHQILALVLGEAAEIDPASRQRMYELPKVAEAAEEGERKAAEAALAAATPGNWAADEAAAERRARLKPTVPEYLREPQRKWRILPTAIVLALAGCILGFLLRITGQLDPNAPLGHWLGLHAAREDDNREPTVVKPSEESPSPTAAATSGTAAEQGAPSKASTTTSASAAKSDEGAKKPDSAAPAPATKEDTVSTPPLPATGAAPAPLPKAGTASAAAPAIKAPTAPTPATPPATPPAPHAGTPAKTASDTEPKKVPPAVVGPAKEPETAPVPRLGRFLYEEPAVLLKLDPRADNWQPLAIEEPVAAHQVLLALPTTRPKVALNAPAVLEMIGGTQLHVLPGDDKSAVGVDVSFGRIVLKSRAPAALRIAIHAGNHSGVLTLSDSESVVALEVTPLHAAGANPESERRPVASQLIVAAGDALWEEGGQKALEIKSPHRVDVLGPLVEEIEPVSLKEQLWIEEEPLGPLDKQALVAMSQLLPPGRSASLGLMELTEHRRKEFRMLATRCLGYLGRFEPMLLALEDPAKKLEWFDHVDFLRQAVARNAETAAAVRRAAEKHFSDEAKSWYRMLWGYADKNLQDGDDEKLVKMLEHENLAFRVLAFWNLHDITGLSLYYKPEQTPAKRQQSILHWKQRQIAGSIRTKPPEAKGSSGKRGDERPEK
jgi:hypothetical protein